MPEIEKSDPQKDTFWGYALGVTAGVASTPLALVKGAIDAANGGSFEDGCNELVEAVYAKSKEFGNRNSGAITGGVTASVTTVILGFFGRSHHKT